ncbi:MAG: hypothetical protein ABEJ48_05805 [Halobacteriales archaeon]
MTDTDSGLTAYLAANPRMIGVLFTIMVLLLEAGTVAARGGGTISGP